MPSGRANIVLTIVAAFAAMMAAMYLINPFRTPSKGPSARILGVAPYRMPSVSMEPTIHKGDHFLVNVATLRNRDPQVGEIVIFQFPPNPAVHYLKRVVATGGQTIEMRAGVIYLNGKRLDEPWLPAEPITTMEIQGRIMDLQPQEIRTDFEPVVVPPGHFFVLGDNRGNSQDSRVWGFVPRDLMIGTYVRLWD